MDWIWKTEVFGACHFKKSLLLAALSILMWKIRLWKSAKKLKAKRTSSSEDSLNIREALFFRTEGGACYTHLNEVYACEFGRYCPAYSLRILHKYLEAATVSIDVCILHFTLRDVERIFVKAHFRGVKVRIITDHTMYLEKSRIPRLQDKGIPVKMKKNFYYQMHNKFLILDQNVLITGSMNWTKQGLCGNWDNIMITSEPNLVSQYHEEFENLWSIL